jgi:hypothetical protein
LHVFVQFVEEIHQLSVSRYVWLFYSQVIMVWFPKRKTFFFGTNEELFIVKKWEHNRLQQRGVQHRVHDNNSTNKSFPWAEMAPRNKVTNFFTDNLIFILDFIKTLKELIFHIFPPNDLELMNMTLNIFKHLVFPLNP